MMSAHIIDGAGGAIQGDDLSWADRGKYWWLRVGQREMI